jgi:hypothetical protein
MRAVVAVLVFTMAARAQVPSPRYLRGEQVYWTVFGSRDGTHTGLLDTDGNADFGANTPGIEPFVIDHGRVTSWTDVHAVASLDSGDRPIPSITWQTTDWSLMITGFGVHDSLGLRYRLANLSAHADTLTLVLVTSPYQVNPPWQRALGPVSTPRASKTTRFPVVIAPLASHDVFVGSHDLDRAREQWTSDLAIDGPPPIDDLSRAVHASIGYILVEHMRPGPRAYARVWVRDATLMSDALLRAGDTATVRQFIQWFVPYQATDGAVPCCIPGPVPELDSDGEFIALITEYVRYTGDSTVFHWAWPRIAAAVANLDSLRHSDSLGLIPKSISHEGYTGRPEHSVWDDCWAIKGYTDAGAVAQRDTLSARLDAAIAKTGDFVPGAIDIDDFDPTSTAIALSPTECNLPRAPLERTFAMYDSIFHLRVAGKTAAYSPYEFRNAGALLRLNERQLAWQVIAAGLRDRHPAAWYAWPEVAFRDTAAANVVGDRPHGWVAAELVRSVLDLFAYSENDDSTLVLGAGVQRAWLTPGVRVTGLHTPFGVLAFREWDDHGTLRVHVDDTLDVPPNGIMIRAPVGASDDFIVVRALPADVTFR